MGLRGPNAKPVKTSVRNEVRQSRRKARRSRAERVCRFIEGLRITSGMHAGRRFKLRPWQRHIIEELYAVDDVRNYSAKSAGKSRTGNRVKRSALICLPRKSGKTTLSAA